MEVPPLPETALAKARAHSHVPQNAILLSELPHSTAVAPFKYPKPKTDQIQGWGGGLRRGDKLTSRNGGGLVKVSLFQNLHSFLQNIKQ